jgi:hypothetical protein
VSTASDGESADTWSKPTDYSGVWTADIDNASLTTILEDRISIRRDGMYRGAIGRAAKDAATADWHQILVRAYLNAGEENWMLQASGPAGKSGWSYLYLTGERTGVLSAGDYLDYEYYSSGGSVGCAVSASATFMEIKEQL